ncbi:hypothetical protein BD779DRAFT_261760 [Infundibulicybe gibba]|nr:hypothetical protein BD779DRAFT_261760 [Infundibulicybe gibba]
MLHYSPNPPMEAPLLQDLADAQVTNYLVAAAATLVVFDHILTIQQEITLIWRNPWNVTSLLYIWNRYYTLIVLAINTSCNYFSHIKDTARLKAIL